MPKKALNDKIVSCKKCPRLIKYCKTIALEKRKSFRHETYWGLPVPNFGAHNAQLLIVGLAPAAHGANRTGRMFTGDRSGEWLYRALHKFSFASRPDSVGFGDKMVLYNALITAAVHCAPPDNKPSNTEIKNCQPFLSQTFTQTPFKVVIALGGLAWKATLVELKKMNLLVENENKFIHGREVKLKNNSLLIASYHPSQQNTFTGRLTEPMFDQVFARAQDFLSQ